MHGYRGKCKETTSRLTEVAGSTVALEIRVAVTLLSMWIAESVLHALFAVMVEFVAMIAWRKT